MDEPRLTFWNFASAVVNSRRAIVFSVILVMIVSMFIAWLMPRWYRARALILPPEEASDFSSLMGASGLAGLAVSAGGFSLPVLASESDVLASMLESRTVIDGVIDSLGLMEIYDASTRHSARLRVKSNLSVNVGSDGVIKVEYVDQDSVRCAQIANALIVKMDQHRTSLATEKAAATRRFIEVKLAETQVDMQAAEDSLIAFQKEYNVIVPEVQATATIEAVAELRTAMIAREVELSSKKLTHSPDHPEVILLENSVAEMRKKAKELENGLAGVNDSTAGYLSISFGDVPDLSLKYAQLMRNVKIFERVYELLTEQLERAKIKETRDTPNVSVLDWAIPQTRKFKPKLSTVGLTAGFLTVVFWLLRVFAKEYWRIQRESSTAFYKNVSNIAVTLRRDLLGIKGKKV